MSAKKEHQQDQERIIKDLTRRLEEVEKLTNHPDWAARASELLHKIKVLTIEAIALASLLFTGQQILADKSLHSEKLESESTSGPDHPAQKKGQPDPKVLLKLMLDNERVFRQTMGDAEFEKMTALLRSLITVRE